MFQIDLENELAHCVRKIGGVVLIDEIGPSPVYANADYLFREYEVVAELKCMERDTRTEGPFLDKVTEMHEAWVRKGLSNPSQPIKSTGCVVR